MPDPIKLTIDSAVEVEGREDAVQLEVRGHTTQTQALQEWQDDAGSTLAELSGDGRLRLGDLDVSALSALIEADDDITLPSSKPLRGWQSLGKISGALTSAVAWIASELHLTGSGGVSGVQAALQAVLRLDNTGDVDLAEVRAGDFEGINETGTSGKPLGQLTGTRGAASNEASAYATKAVGVEAAVSNDTGGDIETAAAIEVDTPVNNGTIDTLYGLRIPDLTQGTANYALHTGLGPVHLGDFTEMEDLGSAPGAAPTGAKRLYAKSDGLYVKNAAGSEVGPLGAGSGGTAMEVTGTAGANLSERDFVYLDRSDNKWYAVDIDASPSAMGPERGLVTESGGITQNNTGTIQVAGVVSGFSGLTAGDDVWASDTAGAYTQAKPTPSLGGSQKAVVRIGVAVSATEVLLDSRTPAAFLKRASLADGSTLTVEHYGDENARSRLPAAFLSSTSSGESLTSYAEVNQDADVDLQYSIRENMLTWWELNEASGTRVDSHGTMDLTDNNTVTQAAGKVGNAAQFTNANNEHLSHADHADLSFGDEDFTIWAWVYLDNKSSFQHFVSKDGGSGSREYALLYNATNDRFRLNISDDGTAFSSVKADNLGSPSTATWYFAVAKHDAASNEISLKINDGTPDTAGHTGGVNDGTAEFGLGRRQDGAQYLDGRMDETAMFRRLTTAAEDTWGYNSGNGRSYADTAPNTQLAQSFQIGSADDVQSVQLYLKKVGSPTGNLSVEIQTDSSGSPSGTPVTNGTSNTVAASSLGTSYGMTSFTFGTNPSLSASTTYWLVLKTTGSGDAQDYVQWGADASSPGYTNGEMKAYDGSSWTSESKDAVFDVIGAGTSYEEPALVGRWNGSSLDVAVRHDDGAGSNADTKTTFKNKMGSTQDLTMEVRLP